MLRRKINVSLTEFLEQIRILGSQVESQVRNMSDRIKFIPQVSNDNRNNLEETCISIKFSKVCEERWQFEHTDDVEG